MKNKYLVAVAVVVVALASVAYAALTQSLTINGTGTLNGTWDVQIVSITRTDTSGGASEQSPPSHSATTASFDIGFTTPGDYATYDVVMKNLGSIKAKVSAVPDLTTINAAEPADVKFTVTSGPAVNTVLNQNDTATAVVKAEWLSAATTTPTMLSKTASMSYTFVQAP